VDENHCWCVLCLIKALTLTTAADNEPASNCVLEIIDEWAGAMGGMDMVLNLLASQSGGAQLLGACGYLFRKRFQGNGKEADIDNVISAYTAGRRLI